MDTETAAKRQKGNHISRPYFDFHTEVKMSCHINIWTSKEDEL